jgi:hypothetical protein
MPSTIDYGVQELLNNSPKIMTLGKLNSTMAH